MYLNSARAALRLNVISAAVVRPGEPPTAKAAAMAMNNRERFTVFSLSRAADQSRTW